MSSRVERLLECVNENCGKIAYDELAGKIGVIEDKLTPAKQGKYIKILLDELLSNYGVEKTEKIMRPCGYQCISDQVIRKAKIMYKNSNSIEGFLCLLNDSHIGGGHLHIKDNNIIGIYDRCYCGIAKSTKNLSPIYCECSGGWFEKLFSSVFEKEVIVKRIDTILNGAENCTFEISNV
jgi:predicted hydrocarbon binding protein